MLSVKFLGNKRVSLVESPIPVPPPGWVRVKMMASGVCRTDIDLPWEKTDKADALRKEAFG